MNRRALLPILSVAFVAACETKPPPPPAPPPVATQTGLATLDAKTALPEDWLLEGGGPLPLLYFSSAQLKLSAGCKKPDGSLDCDALRFLRAGTPVQLLKRSLDGRMSAGSMACIRLAKESGKDGAYALVTAKNKLGAEDGLCRFPDGSYVTLGALEQYGIRVLE